MGGGGESNCIKEKFKVLGLSLSEKNSRMKTD